MPSNWLFRSSFSTDTLYASQIHARFSIRDLKLPLKIMWTAQITHIIVTEMS
jgi:hypothetical protein